MSQLVRLKNLPLSLFDEAIVCLGEPRFRAVQVRKWVYQKRLDTFEGMSNMSKSVRSALAGKFSLEKMQVAQRLESSAGDAVKFGFRLLESDHVVESVLLYDDKRRTVCVSSQLGCGLGCVFCATGTMGFIRNLALDEVVGQLVGVNDYLASKDDKLLTHVVFMGMGEALSNFEVFTNACEVLADNDCFGVSPKRLTVSTAGIVPSIDRLIREGPPVNLAISLNTYDDQRRSAIMPINRTYPIREVIAAGRRFVDKTGNDLTFEYVVVQGDNDSPAAATALFKLLAGIKCKVNCIALNRNPGMSGKVPSHDHVLQFAQMLYDKGIVATVRKSRGDDICGACGQLCTRHQTDAGRTG